MGDGDEVELGEAARAIAQRFERIDGQVRLSDDELVVARDTLIALPAPARQALVEDLVALAVKFRVEGGPSARYGMLQLLALSAELIGEDALALFGAAGIQLDDESLSLLGIEKSRRPAPKAHPGSQNSLFSLMMDEKKKG